MHFLADFLKGIAIGAGAILPGISSGVLCVIFGIYETLLNCTLNFFKNIRHNIKILLPIGLGTFVGIIIFGNILKYIFYAYPLQTKFIFIGLILGSIPGLIKQANSKQNFKPHYLFYFIGCFIIGLLLVILENRLSLNTNFSNKFNFLYLIVCGFLMSAGVIVPGISSTLILILLGIYDAYLLSISSLYIPFLLPLSLGLIIGCICFMNLIKLFLDKFYEQTFFGIIGFTIGSIFVLYPGISSLTDFLIAVPSFLLGFCGIVIAQ